MLMSFVHQESSFQADAKPDREKILGFIPWFRPSSAVGYSQALTKTWEDYKDETGNTRASRKDFADSADFIGWYASKGYYQGFERTDARSLYLAYHEGYTGFEKKTYRKKFEIIGSAHNLKEIRIKEKQKVIGIFVSSLFKRNKNFLGINKFKILANLTKKDVVALGGISQNNIRKLRLLKRQDFAGISFFE